MYLGKSSNDTPQLHHPVRTSGVYDISLVSGLLPVIYVSRGCFMATLVLLPVKKHSV